jgi:hypothetical protein
LPALHERESKESKSEHRAHLKKTMHIRPLQTSLWREIKKKRGVSNGPAMPSTNANTKQAAKRTRGSIERNRNKNKNKNPVELLPVGNKPIPSYSKLPSLPRVWVCCMFVSLFKNPVPEHARACVYPF